MDACRRLPPSAPLKLPFLCFLWILPTLSSWCAAVASLLQTAFAFTTFLQDLHYQAVSLSDMVVAVQSAARELQLDLSSHLFLPIISVLTLPSTSPAQRIWFCSRFRSRLACRSGPPLGESRLLWQERCFMGLAAAHIRHSVSNCATSLWNFKSNRSNASCICRCRHWRR